MTTVQEAVNKPDFKETRLLPLFPEIAHYKLVKLNGKLTLAVYLPNLPEEENPLRIYPKFPGLPDKIKIAGRQIRFEYHDASKLTPPSQLTHNG